MYINQRLLLDNRLADFKSGYNHNWTNIHTLHRLYPGWDSHYVRAGQNVLPFNNRSITKNPVFDALSFTMPRYNPAFTMNFSDVTNRRIVELRKKYWSKPWLIYWSGGIDSTVIITAVLKNLSPGDRANINIACNRISIYENPAFYYQYILPNFNIVDANLLELDDALLTKYYVMDGEPADQLYGGMTSKNFLDGADLLKSWRTEPDGLIELFARIIDRPFAEWHYEIMKQNIESVDIPIENYYDFGWWTFFNLSWVSVLLRPLNFRSQVDLSTDSLKLYFNNFIPFYDTAEYQQWAMTNRVGSRYNIGINERKLASKLYIYNFNHDEYYFKFKTKSESLSRPNTSKTYFCILDDYTRLTLDDNLEQILDLLPAHITA